MKDEPLTAKVMLHAFRNWMDDHNKAAVESLSSDELLTKLNDDMGQLANMVGVMLVYLAEKEVGDETLPDR